jgi:AcrR family transcriptional regulator
MPKKTARPQLTPERIVIQALDLVDEQGLSALSMRGLAKVLGVEAMSLYHWFPSRDHLMDALLDQFLAEIPVPSEGSWEARLQAVSRSFRTVSQRHPGLVPFVVVHRFNTKVALGLLNELLAIVARLHHDGRARAAAFRLYIHWLIGFCLDEAAGFSRGPSAQAPPNEAEITQNFPWVAELGPFNKPVHFDDLFEQGLAAVLLGMRRVGSDAH